MQLLLDLMAYVARFISKKLTGTRKRFSVASGLVQMTLS